MEYDGAWKLYLPEERINDMDSDWPPPYLANGKLVVLPNFTRHGGMSIDRCLIAVSAENLSRSHLDALTLAPLEESAARAYGNSLDTFRFGGVRLFSREPNLVKYTLQSSTLHMDTGTYSASYKVMLPYLPSASSATCSHDVYVPRQYPNVTVQSCKVRMKKDELETIRENADSHGIVPGFYHEIEAPPPVAHTARYTASTMLTDVNAHTQMSVHMFTGSSASAFPSTQAATADTNTNSNRQMSVACIYLWEGDDNWYEHKGFNVPRSSPGKAFNRIDFVRGGGAPMEEEHIEFRFHVVTCVMTQHDFPDPEEETKRVLLGLMNRGLSSRPGNGDGKIHLHLRNVHARHWDAMWATNVVVTPKLGITEEEGELVTQVKRHVRYALYSIYSSVRGGMEALLNPATLGVIDVTGHVVTQGDLWFVPCMTALKPHVTRAVMEARFNSLPAAVRLAAAYGFSGAKFPFTEVDADRYSGSVYWDSVAVTRVFHTAVVGANAWDYYRVTQDKDWLQWRGYPILQGVANFCASVFELDRSSGKYKLINSISLEGRQAPGNAFATNACLLALRGAVEASYVLGAATRRDWTRVLHNAHPVFFKTSSDSSLHRIFRFDEHHEPYGETEFAEPLINLTSTYSSVYFPKSKREARQQAITRNTEYYRTVIEEAGTAVLPLNAALFSYMEGLRAQTEPARVDDFQDKLDTFLQVATEPVWGNMRSHDGETHPLGLNDIHTSALLLWTLLGTCAGVSVMGGITDTQFMYEEMRLDVARHRNMPSTWKDIRVSHLAGGTDRVLVANDVPYAAN